MHKEYNNFPKTVVVITLKMTCTETGQSSGWHIELPVVPTLITIINSKSNGAHIFGIFMFLSLSLGTRNTKDYHKTKNKQQKPQTWA